MHNDKTENELTLDPADWDEVRRVGHLMIDDMIDYMSSVRERPAWQTVSDAARKNLLEKLPRSGQELASVYAQFKRNILPFPTGNQHPRFFGWVMGNGTVTGMLADMLASGMNPHMAGYDQSAALVENQVIDWMKELLCFPVDASGLLVSGGTMANINGLAVARNSLVGEDYREEGLQSGTSPQLTVYGSKETHSWIFKACELMGLGRKAFRVIGVNDDYQVDVEACRESIEADIKAGKKPFCLIGTVGTVNTGAIDDIAALRELADEYGMWLHVDGAFGSMAALAPRSKSLVMSQSTADSIAVDLHKWGYMPFEIACVLVRQPGAQTATFEQAPSYLVAADRGLSVNVTQFADKGLQLTRGFRALKAWMSFKQQGTDQIGAVIEQNISQAKYLKSLVENHEHLELLAPVSLNIVCYRYLDMHMQTEQLNRLNKEILLRLQESGEAVPSQTMLDGKFALRVSITNHRSRQSDFDFLVRETVRHARDIIETGCQHAPRTSL